MRNDKTQSAPDIHERALDYGVRSVRLFRYLKASKDDAQIIIGKQFLRSATSVGANLAEMDCAETRADFIHKGSLAQEEARECLYWLKLLVRAELVPPARLVEIVDETTQLVAIICAIARNSRKGKTNS